MSNHSNLLSLYTIMSLWPSC